jgi:hypothetical protein
MARSLTSAPYRSGDASRHRTIDGCRSPHAGSDRDRRSTSLPSARSVSRGDRRAARRDGRDRRAARRDGRDRRAARRDGRDRRAARRSRTASRRGRSDLGAISGSPARRTSRRRLIHPGPRDLSCAVRFAAPSGLRTRVQKGLREAEECASDFSHLHVARALQPSTRESCGPIREETSVQNVQTEKNQPDRSRGQTEPLIQRNRSVRILAKSIYRELKSQGYGDRQIVALATELLTEVTDDMSRDPARPPAAARRSPPRAI